MCDFYRSFNDNLLRSSVRIKSITICPSNEYVICGGNDGYLQVLETSKIFFVDSIDSDQVLCSIDLSCFGEINCFRFYKGLTVELCVYLIIKLFITIILKE